MLPMSTYGYIQSKQRYASQSELLEVRKLTVIVSYPSTTW